MIPLHNNIYCCKLFSTHISNGFDVESIKRDFDACNIVKIKLNNLNGNIFFYENDIIKNDSYVEYDEFYGAKFKYNSDLNAYQSLNNIINDVENDNDGILFNFYLKIIDFYL